MYFFLDGQRVVSVYGSEEYNQFGARHLSTSNLATRLTVNKSLSRLHLTNASNEQCMSVYRRMYSSINKDDTNKSNETSPKVLSKIHTPNSIDDFRAREEQRETELDKSSATTNDSENEEKIKKIRTDILNASLPFVTSFGWSRDAISKGAESMGYPGVAHGMFPNGGIELIHHFYAKCNEQMIEFLKKQSEADKSSVTPHSPVEFVTTAIKVRLQMIEPYMGQWPQALGIMSLPPNVPKSLAQLLTLVDDICFYANDRSVDVSFSVLYL